MSIQNDGPAEQQACTGYIFQSTNCPDAQISHDNLCQDTYHGPHGNNERLPTRRAQEIRRGTG